MSMPPWAMNGRPAFMAPACFSSMSFDTAANCSPFRNFSVFSAIVGRRPLAKVVEAAWFIAAESPKTWRP